MGGIDDLQSSWSGPFIVLLKVFTKITKHGKSDCFFSFKGPWKLE